MENVPADGSSRGGAKSPGATSDGLVASLAVPDTNSLALDSVLAAEGARVLGVLRDLDLLDLSSERGTVSGTVLAGDADLGSALGLREEADVGQ